MKTKTFLSIVCVLASISMYAQSWDTVNNLLYTNPGTTKVGIGITSPTELLHINGGALKIGNSTLGADRAKNLLKFGDGNYVQIGEWENDDMLSFKASRYNFTNGNVGIGTTAPSYKLDVNGSMYLHKTETLAGWDYSHLYWGGHSLVLGSPKGIYMFNSVDLKPGGVTQEKLYSQLRLYTSTTTGDHELAIQLNSINDCFFNNPGNFGIGTTSPIAKLTVNGNGSFTVPGSSNAIQGLTVNVSTFSTAANAQQSYYLKLKDLGATETAFLVRGDGNVGIGTSTPGVKLDVVGTIRAHEVRVCLNQGCDYVFAPDYNLMSLPELEQFVNTNRHLPEVTPAAEMEVEGIDLSKMNALLLKKVEELTLYVIEQQKAITKLNCDIEYLKTQNL